MTEDWLTRLKAGYDAGYYRTETDEVSQIPFPWQNKTCKDCPFWLNNVCRVDAVQRSGDAHTCIYFDEANRDAARRIISERMAQVRRAWWDQMGH